MNKEELTNMNTEQPELKSAKNVSVGNAGISRLGGTADSTNLHLKRYYKSFELPNGTAHMSDLAWGKTVVTFSDFFGDSSILNSGLSHIFWGGDLKRRTTVRLLSNSRTICKAELRTEK